MSKWLSCIGLLVCLSCSSPQAKQSSSVHQQVKSILAANGKENLPLLVTTTPQHCMPCKPFDAHVYELDSTLFVMPHHRKIEVQYHLDSTLRLPESRHYLVNDTLYRILYDSFRLTYKVSFTFAWRNDSLMFLE